MTRGKVRQFSISEHWGIVDSPVTPGGCLVQSLDVLDEPQVLVAGQDVEFDWQNLENEEREFRYYATAVWSPGSSPSRLVEDSAKTFAGGSWTNDRTVTPEHRMDAFWRDADDAEPTRMRLQLDQLLSTGEYSEGRALFERGSTEDYLGDEAAAIAMYEAALSCGLDLDRDNSVRIQLASSLRNVGRPCEALRILEEFEFSTEYGSARDGFAALVLWDLGQSARALQSALQAADPALGKYRRAIVAYAAGLDTDSSS